MGDHLLESLRHREVLGARPRGSPRGIVEYCTRKLSSMVVHKAETFFTRRTELLEWHPGLPHGSVCVSSHGGDIALWKPCYAEHTYASTSDVGRACPIVREGPVKAGALTEMQFHPGDCHQLFATSLDQKLSVHNLHVGPAARRVLKDTFDWDHWYQTLAVNLDKNLLVVGCNRGYAYQFSLSDGKEISERSRWHKQNKKLIHCEFHPCDSNVLLTAGHDKHMKLWDLRKGFHENDFLVDIPLGSNVNSAHFSPTGNRIVATGQQSKIYVFTVGQLDDPLEISHPNDIYQHMTPIKATWHPSLPDVFVTGSYASLSRRTARNQPDYRCIDIMCARTGDVLVSLEDASHKGVFPVNKFSPNGDVLVSGSGNGVFSWKARDWVADAIRKVGRKRKRDGASDQAKAKKPRRNNTLNSVRGATKTPKGTSKKPGKEKRLKKKNNNEKQSKKGKKK